MQELTEGFLSELLPGEWAIGATNFPMWLGGQRLSPTFEYGTRRTSPLEFDDRVSYRTPAGALKSIVGIDRFTRGRFVWRGRGILAVLRSSWTVAGADPDGSFVAIRFAKTLATPAGIDIIARREVDSHTLRTAVAAAPEQLGMSREEFAGLTWLELGHDVATPIP